jgi:hypothetical protein
MADRRYRRGTTRIRIKPPPRDDNHADADTLCTVDVTPGRLVYWDGQQRGGTLRDVPKHIAMQWLQARYASVVYEPM